ncbi:MAG: beta-lactamase family protein [Planctomycetes bacterium]|nr:beta-lactamase family protein [Planctomycetota bacterium]MCH9724618.1 beta-lactamase family protein [Planctomycetota bacterium]MCH9777907.1 beta-lactamase family protein [Planctomycetota bacterium]MCH9792985.1 beta-lactamase family protein [Planctomycetota bacterium]
MPTLEERLPLTSQRIGEGIESQLHTGMQIYVSLQGEVIADAGIGEARPGVPMTETTLNLWLSAGKPLTAMAIARLWEQGKLSIDDPVTRFIPEFGTLGKEPITLLHLLNHTAGFRPVETGWPDIEWEEIIQRICNSPLEANWQIGKTAGYHVTSSWFILGEILQRILNQPYSELIRELILEPLGMTESWIGMPREVYEQQQENMAYVYQREKGEMLLTDWHAETRCLKPSPGGNARGPIRELGWFYECLLHQGMPLFEPQTVETMTSPHREGKFDLTLQHIVDYGLGFIINSNRYGEATVPYGFGKFASEKTFGHGGSQSSIAFADLERELVVAFVANGRPGEPKHQRRAKEINEAIYEDLKLS